MSARAHETFGPYVLYEPIARGGMATVHAARLVGAEGFNRLVAAKKLHPEFADDPDFVAMLHDEARIASKIHHPNVVPVLDVVSSGSQLVIVQDYVHGVALHTLMRVAHLRENPFPVSVAVAIVSGVLEGLHAAHEANDEMGVHLGIIHRDVSPQNVMVTTEGVPRLLDFGIARARNRAQLTRPGLLKGKIGYMAPEQLRMEAITRRVDLYAMGVLMWELLVNRRLYSRENEATFVKTVLAGHVDTLLSAVGPAKTPEDEARLAELAPLEPIVARAMMRSPESRYDSARAMLDAIRAVCPAATPVEVARWVQTLGTEDIDRRQRMLAANEESWRSSSKMTFAASTQASRVDGALLPQVQEPVFATAPQLEPALLRAPTRRITRPLHLVPAVLAGALLAGLLLELVHARQTSPAAQVAAPPPPTFVSAAAEAPPPAALDVLPSAHGAKPGAVASPPPARVIVVRPPPARVAPAPSPAPSPPPAATPADPASDCNPPFYFQGSRKVFKPGCL